MSQVPWNSKNDGNFYEDMARNDPEGFLSYCGVRNRKGKKFSSPFRQDDEPSCSLFKIDDVKPIIKDFGTNEYFFIDQFVEKLGLAEGKPPFSSVPTRRPEGTSHSVPDTRAGSIAPGVFPFEPVIETLPPRFRHFHHIYIYRNEKDEPIYLKVRRNESDGSKTIRFLTWGEGKFLLRGPSREQRVLYNQNALTLKPAARVHLCEGEKTCEALQVAFPQDVAVTFGAVTDINERLLKPLQRRDVVYWPDNDTAGQQGQRRIVDILNCCYIDYPEGFPEKWDAADPLPEGWTLEKLLEERIKEEENKLESNLKLKEGDVWPIKFKQDNPTRIRFWPQINEIRKECILNPVEKGIPHYTLEPNRKNAETLIFKLPCWKGIARYNLLDKRYYMFFDPETGDKEGYPRAFEDADYSRWAVIVGCLLEKDIPISWVRDGLDKCAKLYSYNPMREYFESLAWDGQNRIEQLFPRYLGKGAEWATEVSAKFMVAAVARALAEKKPYEHHWMPVICGAEGQGKTKFGKLLFGEGFYKTLYAKELGSKDSYQELAGSCCIEIGELAALRNSDIETIKSYLTQSADTYRPSYGRHVITSIRNCVFYGTTNNKEFLKHGEGNRRFVPIYAEDHHFDDVWLSENRDQLWAEAYHVYTKDPEFNTWDLNHIPQINENRRRAEEIDGLQEKIETTIDRGFLQLHDGDKLLMTEVTDVCGCVNPSMGDYKRYARILRGMGYERTTAHIKGLKKAYKVWMKVNGQRPEPTCAAPVPNPPAQSNSTEAHRSSPSMSSEEKIIWEDFPPFLKEVVRNKQRAGMHSDSYINERLFVWKDNYRQLYKKYEFLPSGVKRAIEEAAAFIRNYH